MTALSSKELDTLIEALDLWEDKCSPMEMLDGTIHAMDMNAADLGAEIQSKFNELQIRHRALHANKKEISTLLKAKLIGMKHEISINEAMSATAPPKV